MKRLLLPLLATLVLPTAVNAELVELINDGKYYQDIHADSIFRRGDWIHANIFSSIYQDSKTYRYDRMKINCKRRILEINWGALTLRRKDNGLWEETWKRYVDLTYLRFLLPVKEPKKFKIGGLIIFQETAEGAYNRLCKR